MSAKTVDTFLSALEKSQLITAEHLAAIRKSTNGSTEANSVARQLIKEGKLTRWQAAQLLHGRFKLFLGKYKLLEQLGSTEVSKVYLAEHSQMARRVVLKTLPRRDAAGKDNGKSADEDSFLSNARSIASLDHRNIVHVFDFEREQDKDFMVMEFVEGRDLQAWVEKRGPLPLEEVADYLCQAAEGLEYAHKQNMIHGDVRPAQLFVDPRNTVKIVNFGMARMTAASVPNDEERDAVVLAPFDYLSPEQAENPGQPTVESDIYSLGCTGYFLLTGKAPFAEGTYKHRREQHARGELRPLRKLRTDVPAEIAELLRGMMIRRADDRTPLDEVVETLKAWLDEHQIPVALPAVESRGTSSKAGSARKPNTLGAAAGQTFEEDDIPLAEEWSDSQSAVEDALPLEDEVSLQEEEAPMSFTPTRGNKRLPVATPLEESAPAEQPSLEVATQKATKATKTKAKREHESEPTDATTKIVLALAGVVLLALLGVGGYAISQMNQGNEEQVAQTTTPTPQQPVTAPVVPEKQPPVKPAGPEKTPAVQKPETKDPTMPVGPTVPVPMGTDPMGTGPKDPNGMKDPIAKVDPPVVPPVDPPMKDPANPDPPAKPVDPPADPPKDPPVPAEKINPFETLETHAKLPEAKPIKDAADPAGQPVILGKLNVPTGERVLTELLGGETASPQGKIVFALRFAAAGADAREWEIISKKPGEGNDLAPVIARFSGTDGNLSFQWTTEGLNDPNSNYLRNCIFFIRALEKQHVLFLRTPAEPAAHPSEKEKVEPLVANLDKPAAMKVVVAIDYPPDAEHVKIEVVGLDGPFPKHHFVPGKLLEKGTTTCVLGSGNDAMLELKIEGKIRTKLELSGSFWLAGKPPKKLTMAAVKKETNLANAQLIQLQAMLKQINDVKDKAQAAKLLPQKSQYESQRAIVDSNYKKLLELSDFYAAVNTKGLINYRAYVQIGEHQLELVRTAPDPGPMAAAEPMLPGINFGPPAAKK